MRSTRFSLVVLVAGLLMACGSDGTDSSSGASSDAVGRVMFQRAPGGEVTGEIETDVYLVDAGGSESDVELFFEDGGAGRWSPDGREVSVFCCDDPGVVAHIVDVDTGDVREVETP